MWFRSGGGGYPFYGLYRTDFLRQLTQFLRPDLVYYNEALFLHQLFNEGGARFCPNAVLIYNGSNSSIHIPSRRMLGSMLRHSLETHAFYLRSELPLIERFALLREVARFHYPYIKHLAIKALRGKLGG